MSQIEYLQLQVDYLRRAIIDIALEGDRLEVFSHVKRMMDDLDSLYRKYIEQQEERTGANNV